MNPVRGMTTFMRGVLRLPLAIQLWLAVLMLVNGVLAVVYIHSVEGRVVLATFLVGATLMAILTDTVGFVRLLGLGHFPWFVLLPYLWTRLSVIPASEPMGLWIRGLMVVNTLSLVFDVVDVIRYVRGERSPLVDGL